MPPRDAVVVELAFDAPASLDQGALPLRVTARLRHRSRTLEVQRAACADVQAGWGRACAAIDGLDPCAPQPVTEVARAEVLLGGVGGAATAAGPRRGAASSTMRTASSTRCRSGSTRPARASMRALADWSRPRASRAIARR